MTFTEWLDKNVRDELLNEDDDGNLENGIPTDSPLYGFYQDLYADFKSEHSQHLRPSEESDILG